ncbi:RNA polymerase factor sigma-54 [Neisseria animalis]|uniref:RNA polymerase sigma-54 factor n=1 Tax=Neisseria animalis TaxID=492 RepID=A0A5P3MRL9_NEIAN|nr:RNA polymerase factor sigma-54 [Neisseria animalis]QEY24100.1 RNA polymerase sigma-54 factor [Neisseria animalis]ROW32668.1 RNA polymerase sigma-54 factor [Neisseria animalis]VEE06284.1 rna polymerase sigma-54 factor rpon [Neisseria animalis]
MNPHFGLQLKQTQQLNQNLQQALRVLQLSSIDLEREVEDWLQENPLLEREEGETAPEADWGKLTASRGAGRLHSEDFEDEWLNIAGEEDFYGYLHAQVCEHPLSEREAGLVHILIDFLDEQGYLTEQAADIIEHTPLDWMLDEEDVHQAVDALQAFDPPGVAASGLTESLMLQLMRLPASPERRLAARLVQNHFSELGKNRAQNIKRFRKLFPQADSSTIQTALDLIASLRPYPAYGFAVQEPTAYIRPDVWVKEDKDGWKVVSNEAAWPRIRLNQEYCDLFKDTDDVSPEWKEKLNEARQKVNSLLLRESTVVRLAEYIVERQQDFFMFGEIGMTPLLLKDAAAELGVAESTVSRAANQKYLACPRGLFALRYFFTQAVNADADGEGVSQEAVKAIIVQLVENENGSKPYSDEALAQLLKQQGISIARRTVAKYRELLDIPPAHKRKAGG